MRCLEACKKLNTTCPVKDCRYWIEYKDDLNCTFESINKNDAMTLREVAERIGVSYVRIKQIEDKVIDKIRHMF